MIVNNIHAGIYNLFAPIIIDNHFRRVYLLRMDELKKYMEYHELTQLQLAERLGVCQSTVSKLLAGKVGFSTDMIEMIEEKTDKAVPFESWKRQKG